LVPLEVGSIQDARFRRALSVYNAGYWYLEPLVIFPGNESYYTVATVKITHREFSENKEKNYINH
jgi:hypothetical protein